MRALFLGAASIFLALAPAAATEASWPIASSVEFPTAAASGAAGVTTATVEVTVDDDATRIEVEVYGVDGMRAGDSNVVHVHRIRLTTGERLVFRVAIHPGPGQSFLIVSTRAHFAHAGDGGTVRSFPFGHENAAQQREHSRCVRRDPDGEWIRDPDCVTP